MLNGSYLTACSFLPQTIPPCQRARCRCRSVPAQKSSRRQARDLLPKYPLPARQQSARNTHRNRPDRLRSALQMPAAHGYANPHQLSITAATAGTLNVAAILSRSVLVGHRLRCFVNPLTQDHFAVGVLLQHSSVSVRAVTACWSSGYKETSVALRSASRIS